MEEYFAGLLGGVEKRVVGRKRRAENDREKEEKLRREEVRRAIKNIKDEKVVGMDEIPGKVWKYGGRRWKDSYGISATEYGREMDGRKDGRKEK